MFRRTPFFLLGSAIVAWGLAVGQAPASNQGQTGDPQSQSKPQAPAETGDQKKPADSNVLILKAPKPLPVPHTVAELRAVDLEKRPKLSSATRLELIKLMQAEFVHVRKYVPLGDKSLTINPQGQVSPNDAALFQEIQAKGAAAKVGDKIQITSIAIKEKSIVLQLNGGAKKKSKWYQHISVGVGGPGGGLSPTDDAQTQATGAEMTLQFSKQVPEMNAEELRKLLSPVLDFSVKTAAQVYAETLPPKVKEAIKNHEVLVGMNHEMVIAAKDRPPQKDREKDDKGKEYEEWIYGTPPQDTVFVRFYGDEVTQVKTAKAGGGPVVIKTQKEVDVKDGVVTLAALQASSAPQDVKQEPDQPSQPTYRPTLRREGEQDTEILKAPNGQTQGQQQQPHPDEPEWGTDGKQSAPQNGQQPPDAQQPPTAQPTPAKPPQ